MNLVVLHGSLHCLFVFLVVFLAVVLFPSVFLRVKTLCIHAHHVVGKLVDEMFFNQNNKKIIFNLN
jgi:hypothetical protein